MVKGFLLLGSPSARGLPPTASTWANVVANSLGNSLARRSISLVPGLRSNTRTAQRCDSLSSPETLGEPSLLVSASEKRRASPSVRVVTSTSATRPHARVTLQSGALT